MEEEEAMIAIRALRIKKRDEASLEKRMESVNMAMEKEREVREKRSKICLTMPHTRTNEDEIRFYQKILSGPPPKFHSQRFVHVEEDWTSSGSEKEETFPTEDFQDMLEEDEIQTKHYVEASIRVKPSLVAKKKEKTRKVELQQPTTHALSDFSCSDDDSQPTFIDDDDEAGGYLSDDFEHSSLHTIGLAAKAPPLRKSSQRRSRHSIQSSSPETKSPAPTPTLSSSSSSSSLYTRRGPRKKSKNVNNTKLFTPNSTPNVLDFTPGQRLRVRPSRSRRCMRTSAA